MHFDWYWKSGCELKNVDPKNSISRQNSNNISGSDIKRRVKDIKASEFDAPQTIDVAIINGKMISIKDYHTAAEALSRYWYEKIY